MKSKDLPFFLAANELTSPSLLRIVGEAGTGKSQLLKALRDVYRETDILVIAPTGKAAQGIKGRTLHSVVGITIGEKPTLRSALHENNKFLLKSAKLVFLDEVYMLSSKTFELLHSRLSDVRNNTDLFGGVRIVVAGDPLQLPPVGGSHVTTSILWEKIQNCVCLTQKMRQTDPQFRMFLERLRLGKYIQQDFHFMTNKDNWPKSSILENCPSFEDFVKTYVTLVGNRAHTVLINKFVQEMRCNMEGQKVIKSSVDRDIELHDQIRDRLFSENIETLNEQTYYDLYLSFNDRVMVLENTCTPMGIVNGATGTVKGFLYKDETSLRDNKVPLGIFVQMDHRKEEAVLIEAKRFGKNSFKQIPVALCYAATVHKMQGSTCSHLIIDQDSCFFDSRLMYVAWSRARNPQTVLTLPVRMNRYEFQSKKALIGGISSKKFLQILVDFK